MKGGRVCFLVAAMLLLGALLLPSCSQNDEPPKKGETEQEVPKTTMTIEEGISLAIGALKEFLNADFSLERLDIAYITTKEKKFKKVSKENLKNVLNKVK